MSSEALPQGWQWIPFGVVADFVNGDRGENYPTQLDRAAEGVPFINTGHIQPNGRLSTTGMDHITRESFERLRSGKVRAGDIVYCLRGSTIGKTARNHFDEGAIASSLVIVRAKARACQGYLYFYLTSPLGKRLVRQHDNGSAQPNLSVQSLSKYPVPLPPMEEQHAIAHILGALDDRIELNRRMSETLEATARALFKSWFVDFDPVRAKAEGRDPGLPKPLADLFPASFDDSELGPMPSGWEVGDLETIASVVDCLHSKKPERQVAGFPMLQLSNVRDDGLVDLGDAYLIDGADYQQWVSRMEASPGDCVVTNVGRVGAVAQMPAGRKAALGRNMTGVRCKPSYPYPTFLVECLLSTAMRNEIAMKMDTGTILDALNVRSIPRLRFTRPTSEVMLCFERQARPFRAQMEARLTCSQTLGSLRDALLPKLISGELRVKDAERWITADRVGV